MWFILVSPLADQEGKDKTQKGPRRGRGATARKMVLDKAGSSPKNRVDHFCNFRPTFCDLLMLADRPRDDMTRRRQKAALKTRPWRQIPKGVTG